MLYSCLLDGITLASDLICGLMICSRLLEASAAWECLPGRSVLGSCLIACRGVLYSWLLDDITLDSGLMSGTMISPLLGTSVTCESSPVGVVVDSLYGGTVGESLVDIDIAGEGLSDGGTDCMDLDDVDTSGK